MSFSAPAKNLLADIRRAWEINRLAQAYVLTGPVRGSGTVLARDILQLLFCQSADPHPCGKCPGCRGADEDRLADVFYLEPVKKAQLIGVEEVRTMCLFLGKTSYAGGWKAAVLRYADRMTIQAANAFLKMLEEPPPQTLFLLLSDQPHGLLPTILSRCQRVTLPADQDAIRPWMAAVAGLMNNRSEGSLSGLAAAAELDALLKEKRKAIEGAETAAWKASDVDEDEDALDARIVARYKEMRAVVLQTLLLWQRDLLAAASGAEPDLWVFAEHRDAVRRQAEGLTVAQALARVEAVEEIQAHLDENVSEDAVLEAGMMRLFGDEKNLASGHQTR
jgi:DNA polymerase-3 subunit delta'